MLAAIPIAVILLLMMAWRWSAARAGSVGLVVALLVAWFGFGLGTTVMPELGVVRTTGGALAEAVFLAMTILWIIFPALCIHELQVRTGGMDVLQQAMGRITGDPRIMALLVAWFFVLFVEGAAGFGTSVALAAPFLVSAGFGRVAAVSIALIGHAVGVSFGAVGTPVLPQVAASGFSQLEIAGATASYHVLLGWMMPLVVMLLAARALPGGARGTPLLGWALFAGFCFLLPYYLLARYVGPELRTLAGALVGAVLFILVLRFARHQHAQLTLRGQAWATSPGSQASKIVRTLQPATATATATESAPVQTKAQADAGSWALLRAGAPYLLLIGLIVITRLVPPVQKLLREVAVSWTYATFNGSMQILYHPGTMLLVTFMLASLWQRAPLSMVGSTLTTVARRLMPVTMALVAMLGLSRVMVHAGMIDALAATAAAGVGDLWPLFAPAIGVLGTFVTGSATASNILFTGFQVATAQQLGLSVLGITAAQGFGAAVGNIICPHNIVAASATVNLVGREGEVLRLTVLVTLAYAMLGGVLAMLGLN